MKIYYALMDSLIGGHSAYFTNFVKVVLPEAHFKGEKPIQDMLNQSRNLRSIYTGLLQQETEILVLGGCRVFVSFGNTVCGYFREMINTSPCAQFVTCSGNIEAFTLSGEKCYFVPERHYAYYSQNKTAALTLELKKLQKI